MPVRRLSLCCSLLGMVLLLRPALAVDRHNEVAQQASPEATRQILQSAPQLAPARQDQAGPPFSLTISGGISLGAYEAGLNWVLTEWLKTKQPRWRDSSLGSGPLIGVTGASAGAINALLTAVRWCEASPKTSVDNNLYSTTWRAVGLNTLLPASRDKYFDIKESKRDPDFIFSRKLAFTPVLEELDRRLAPVPAGSLVYLPGCEIRVGLMVTKAHPRTIQVEGLSTKSQRFLIPLLVKVVGRDLRFFLNTDLVEDARYHNLLGNMLWLRHGADQEPGQDPTQAGLRVATADVLAAVQASAAHPSSFGPVELGHCTLPSECPGNRQSPDPQCRALGERIAGRSIGNGSNGQAPDMVLCKEPFVDGGAFDNVPVGVAMAQVESRLFPPLPAQERDASLPVRYLYMDAGIRRELPATSFPGTCREAPGTPAGAPGAERPPRDPIGELATFVGGMYASARDYELHNVLRYNDWNLTPTRLTQQTLDLTTKACAARPRPSLCTDRDLEETAPAAAANVEQLEARGAVGAWLAARDALLIKLQARLRTLEASKDPLVVGARTVLASRMTRLRETPRSGRRLQIPTRFAPITGDMISHFAAFIDRPFRDYDYYAGIYDGLYSITSWDCANCDWPAQRRKMDEWLAALRIEQTGVQTAVPTGTPETSDAVAIYRRLRDLETAVRTDAPVSAPPVVPVAAGAPPPRSRPAQQVLEAISAQDRCERGGTPSRACFADCGFDSFVDRLAKDYQGEPELAAKMLARSSRWWTVPAVRVADRVEVLEEERNDREGVDKGAVGKGLNVLRPVGSLVSYHAYYETADPRWFSPLSAASHPLARVVAPYLVLSTSSDRTLSLGLLHYGIRTGPLSTDVNNRFAALADLSVRSGTRPRPEPMSVRDDLADIFTDRSILSLDLGGGPALRYPNPWISSLQLRAGTSLGWLVNRPVFRRNGEVVVTFVQDMIRLAVGCQTHTIPFGEDCRNETYLSVGLNDLPSLIEHIIF